MNTPLLHEKLNTETARIAWAELQIQFARGNTVYVAPDLDLVETARLLAADDTARLQPLISQGRVARVGDAMAKEFAARNQTLWAVVVAPWVLVQPCED